MEQIKLKPSLLDNELDYYYHNLLMSTPTLTRELEVQIPIYYIKKESKWSLDNFITYLEQNTAIDAEKLIFRLNYSSNSHFKRLLNNIPNFLHNIMKYFLLFKEINDANLYYIDIQSIYGYLPVLKINSLSTKNDYKMGLLKGIVKSNTGQFPSLKIGVYVCRNCGTKYKQYHEFNHYTIPVCNIQKTCTKRHVILDELESFYSDIVKIDLQEIQTNVAQGEQPKSIYAFAESFYNLDLTPGKQLELAVIVKKHNLETKGTPFYQRYLDIIGITEAYIKNDSLVELDKTIMDQVKKDFATYEVAILQSLTHMALPIQVKRAILLQLVGGIKQEYGETVKGRGDIHILLIGSPGVGKSQLLKNAVALSGGVFTSGVSSTSVGLTAAVVKDTLLNGKWAVEAGAFVFADNRYLAIDEMDKIPSTQISGVHEAMEQQSISLAKAGLVMTLNTRCPVLAAANPTNGEFIPEVPITKQISLPPTILNRFDLVFLLNSNDMDLDSLGASIFSARSVGVKIDTTKFKRYLELCKSVKPIMTQGLERCITALYKKMKKNSTMLVTARQFECIIRLLEARAKLEFSDFVTDAHFKYVEQIILYTMSKQNLDMREVETSIPTRQYTFRRKLLDIIKTTPKIKYEQLMTHFEATESEYITTILAKLVKHQLLYKPSFNTYAIL